MPTTQTVIPPVREGELLAGKYRVERVLGVGGMGVVVAARHEQLEHLVAIKFVREDALGNPEAVERFLREARSAAKLRSDHAARVLDVGKLDSGAPYMVMEFLDGSDLAQVLVEGGPMAADVAVRLILQACEAVAEAHAAGIVHRDLKPQNLFLTTTVGGTPKLKVLDFGVSKASGFAPGAQGLTRTSAMLGSPLYMAPEQMRSSRDVDGRVDIWALGVVLFELLTGRWPFEAETMPELCLKVVGDPPQSLLALRSDLPPALIGVVERCLEKLPANRFADIGELATALEPFGPPPSRLSEERSRIPPVAVGTTLVPAALARASLPRVASEPSNAPVATSARGSTPAGAAQRSGKGWRAAAWLLGALMAAAIIVVASLTVISRRADPGSIPGADPAAPRGSGAKATLAQDMAPSPPAEAPHPNGTGRPVDDRGRMSAAPTRVEPEMGSSRPPLADSALAAVRVDPSTSSRPRPASAPGSVLSSTASGTAAGGIPSSRGSPSTRSFGSKPGISDDDIPSLR